MFSIPASLNALIYSQSRTDSKNGCDTNVDVLSSKLREIGAVSLEEYLTTPEESLPPIRYDIGLDASSPWCLSRNAESPRNIVHERSSIVSSEEELINACMTVFGNTDGLKYEFTENGAFAIQCSLSVIRPDGLQRLYWSRANHRSKMQAKADVHSIAVTERVIDFISGYTPSTSFDDKKILVHEKSPTITQDSDRHPIQDESVRAIEECFEQCTTGMAAPRWFEFNHEKKEDSYGAALHVQISHTDRRVYSTPPTLHWPNASEAKAECARLAIKDGVLDFIKSANVENSVTNLAPLAPEPARILSVAEFRSTLPRPFPEPCFMNQALPESSILTWLNELTQNVTKGTLTVHFHYFQVKALHGCVLQAESSRIKTYVVGAWFAKRKDAKKAVCLQAMSEGLGNFARSLAVPASKETRHDDHVSLPDIPNAVSEKMRRRVQDKIWPDLFAECQAIGRDFQPVFKYKKSKNEKRFGCALKLVLPRNQQSSTAVYRVPPQYKSADDAKVAVCCVAADSGVMEFLRSRRNPTASTSSSKTQEVEEVEITGSTSLEPGELEVSSDTEAASGGGPSTAKPFTKIAHPHPRPGPQSAFSSTKTLPPPLQPPPSFKSQPLYPPHDLYGQTPWPSYGYSTGAYLPAPGLHIHNTLQMGEPISPQFVHPPFPTHHQIPPQNFNNNQFKRKATEELKKEGSLNKRRKEGEN